MKENVIKHKKSIELKCISLNNKRIRLKKRLTINVNATETQIGEK